jgi:hypothetical protein
MSFPLSARTAISSYAPQRVKNNIGDERPAAAFLAADWPAPAAGFPAMIWRGP